MRFGSVRARLMAWNVAIVAMLTIVLGLAVSWRTRSELQTGIDRDLRERAARNMGLPGWGPGQVPGPPPGGPGPGGGFFQRSPGGNPDEAIPPRDSGGEPRMRGPGGGPGFPGQGFDPNTVFIAQGSFRPRVFDLRGKSISQFTQDEPWDPQALFRPQLGGDPLLTYAAWQGEEHRVLTYRRHRDQGDFIVQYATPLAETRRAIVGINQTLLALLPLALFVAGMGGYMLTERALRPVGRIASLAERISGENLAERLPVQGNDEFAQLASTINASLDRLESAFRELSEAMERQQRFTADASHELKSPLTAIKAQTSLALSAERGAADYRDALEAIDRSAGRMGELIDDLLRLARSESAPMHEPFQTVSLTELVRDAAREAVPAGRPKLAVEFPDGLAVSGRRGELLRLLANLLSNAARHTPAEGTIRVRAHKAEGTIAIEVADTGEGIPPEHIPHLGERFYRVDSARSRAAGGWAWAWRSAKASWPPTAANGPSQANWEKAPRCDLPFRRQMTLLDFQVSSKPHGICAGGFRPWLPGSPLGVFLPARVSRFGRSSCRRLSLFPTGS